MEFLELSCGKWGECKTSREKRSALPVSPENDPQLGLVQVPLIAIGGLTHGQTCFFWAETHRVVYLHDPSKVW